MKLHFLPAIAVAAAAASSADLASATACSLEEHAGAYTRLAVLMSMESFFKCSTDADYNLLYATELPTREQTERMCASENCNTMISTILSRNPPNCELTVTTSGLSVNVFELTNDFAALCASTGIAMANASPLGADAVYLTNSSWSNSTGL